MFLSYDQRKHRRKSTEPQPGLSYAVRQAQLNKRFKHNV